MKLSQELLNNLIEITSNSAVACYPYIGKNEKILADKAATDVMREELNKIQSTIDSIPRRKKKKRYTKEVAKWVKEKYSDRLKNLTINEGKILVKLIYRETNTSSYQILRSYRGALNAFFWQTMARFWNNNLKTVYDPVNVREDMLIEHILIQAKLEGKLK